MSRISRNTYRKSHNLENRKNWKWKLINVIFSTQNIYPRGISWIRIHKNEANKVAQFDNLCWIAKFWTLLSLHVYEVMLRTFWGAIVFRRAPSRERTNIAKYQKTQNTWHKQGRRHNYLYLLLLLFGFSLNVITAGAFRHWHGIQIHAFLIYKLKMLRTRFSLKSKLLRAKSGIVNWFQKME